MTGAGLFARRVALGVTADVAPAVVFVGVGLVLGPPVLNVIPTDILAQADPIISVTLAILGVFVGLGYAAARVPAGHWWTTGAATQAVITMGTVAGAMYLLLAGWELPLPVDVGTAAVVLGLCSAASAAPTVARSAAGTVVTAAHLADLDDIPIVVFGAVAVSAVALGGAMPALARSIGVAVVAGLAVGFAGSLLFSRAPGAPERGVFVTGIVLLLGGVAAYATASPLASGCVAGLLWGARGGRDAPGVGDELRKLQHPFVALLLIIAGASVQFSYALLWIAAPLVLTRLTGKLLGSIAIAHVLGVPPGLLGAMLLPQGVLGIALALNVQQVLGTGDTILVSAVTLATAASELLLPVVAPREASR